MDLSLSDEQKLLQESVARFFRSESTMARVRAAEPLGFDPLMWWGLCGMGLPLMGTSAPLGGSESGMLDMALVAIELGRHLAPVPLIEALCAARLLEAARRELASEWLPAAVTGEGQLLTLALRPALDGRWDMVPAGAIASAVIGMDGDRLIAVRHDPPRRERPMANLGCAPLAHRSAREGRVSLLAEGDEAWRRFRHALAEWQVLTAAALVGLAERALEIALAYVKERRQFGVAIATFQTIAHRLADVSTSVVGARLLAHKAAWAHDEHELDARSLAQMAFLFGAETAELAAGESLHFHGGYGFTLEYDIQLYYRRAKAWPLVLGSISHAYQRLASAWAGAREA